MTRIAVDLSNYQSQFSLGDARTLKANGVSAVIIGRQARNRAYEAQQAAAALDAGLTIIGEYWISLGGVWPDPLPESRFIAIDVEPGSEFTTEADIDNALAQVATTGRTPVIYSSRWAWDALGLATAKYAGLTLWNANYDGRADGFALPSPFGGWTTCAIDQYTDKGALGLTYPVDVNAIEDGFWARCAPQQVNDPDHEDGFDTGADRLTYEAILREVVIGHARAEGDPQVLHDIIDGRR